MKFVVHGASRKLGAVVGEGILDLAAAAGAEVGLFASLGGLIESGQQGLDAAERLIARHGASDDPALISPLVGAVLHAPFPGRRIALAGSNNPDHVSRGANGLFDFEAEVAIVLGRGGKGLRAEQWQERVWGTVLLIDWSVRNDDLLSNKRPFYAHKVFDRSKSLGPWIAVGEVDPMACRVQTRVNGVVRQDFDSGNMIHSYWELLEQMSEDLTLHPGDILAGGTGPGTAADSTVPLADGRLPLDNFLKVGDLVEVSAPQLGTLSGRVVPWDGPRQD